MPIVDQNNKEEYQKYCDYVRTSPYRVATQDPAWTYVKEGWDGEYVYLTDDNGNIISAMSIIFRAVLSGHALAYAPRGPVSDPYDADLTMRLIKEAEPVLKKHNAFVLRFDPEVVFDEELDKLYADRGLVVRNRGHNRDDLIQPIFNMMLDIKDKTWDDLMMKEFGSKTRYNVRLSERKGLTVRWSTDPEDIKTFYEIYKITNIRDKISGRPLSYFERMVEAFPEGTVKICLVEHEGEALSGAVCVNYGKKMWYMYGASSNEKRNLMPNYAMHEAMLKWALELKKELYDFGGVLVLDMANGLYRFKEGFCHKQGVTELCGEYDKVYDKFWYILFTTVVPTLKTIKRRIRDIIKGKKKAERT